MANLPLPKLGWAEGHSPISKYVQTLARALTESDNSPWTLEYPQTVADILTDNTSDQIAILSTRPFAASTATEVLDQGGTVPQIKRYLRLRRPAGALDYINLQIGTEYDKTYKPSGDQTTDYSLIGVKGGRGYNVGDVLKIVVPGVDSRDNTTSSLTFTITVTAVTATNPKIEGMPESEVDLSGPITSFTVALDPAVPDAPTKSYVQTGSFQGKQAVYDQSDTGPKTGTAATFNVVAISDYSPAYGGPTTNPAGSYLKPDKSSVEVRWYWYVPDDLQSFPIDDSIQISYYISFYGYTGNLDDTYDGASELGSYLSMVQIGDPTIDTPNFTHYQISPAYVGTIEPYSSSTASVAVNPDPDHEYNWFLTAGAFSAPFNGNFPVNDAVNTEPYNGFDKKYGNNTGMGNTDLIAVGTRYGVKYQSHQVSITTINPFMAKLFLSASQWTHKYHSSKIIVTHTTERERGMLWGTIIFDRSSIFNLDELYFNRGEPDERIYKTFLINSNGNFIANSANVLYTIALLKYDKKLSPIDEVVDDTEEGGGN